MDPERWQQIKRIYHTAIGLEPGRREEFLRKACPGDEFIVREVATLLAQEGKSGDLFEAPALEAVARAVAQDEAHRSQDDLAGGALLHYRIGKKIGEGGMGEVYRARDMKLGREVAIKILPSELAQDADRMARFRREAQVLALLDHPNITSIYSIEESGGLHALVMQLAEGQTLAERIAVGPIPLGEALPMAKQIAEALEYAHEKNIVHRDLKPANVKIAPDGQVKVLDFGLAKAMGMNPSGLVPAESPTLTTQAGLIMGTAAYMSPEQARGQTVDKRGDIWSFGVVLYEMLTGQRMVTGKTLSDTLAAVLTKDIDWGRLPSDTPAGIRRLIRRCLERDRNKRLQSAGDARIEIEEYLSGPAMNSALTGQGDVPTLRQRLLPWAAAGVFLVALIVLGLLHFRASPPANRVIKSYVSPPEQTNIDSFALSPDGRMLAIAATDASGRARLWVRPLDSLTAQPLDNTDGAFRPFWSPDSRFIAFFANDELRKIEAAGGSPQKICNKSGTGGTWSRAGTIVFAGFGDSGPNPLFRVPATGGEPTALTELDASRHDFHTGAFFLPDGRHFLYAVKSERTENSGIFVATLDSKERTRLLEDLTNAAYVTAPSGAGYVIFWRSGRLIAQGFDVETLRLLGDPLTVAEHVGQTSIISYSYSEEKNGVVSEQTAALYYATYSASENGTLIFGSGDTREKRLAWFDRGGRELGATGEPAAYDDLRLSPDGTKIASNTRDLFAQIWMHDLTREIRSRITFDPATDHASPIWSQDGSRILYAVDGGKARLGIYQKPVDSSGGEVLLLPSDASETQVWPTACSSDGRFILYSRGDLNRQTHAEIWVLPLIGDSEPRLFVRTPVAAYDGQFSPDGRWVAYTSKESDKEEVYIVTFDAAGLMHTNPGSVIGSPGGQVQISTNGGRCPRWRRDGKEIYYLTPDNEMMAVKIEKRGAGVGVRMPQPLFRAAIDKDSDSPYDVSPDGTRFVVNTLNDKKLPLTLVVNWTAQMIARR